VAVPVAADEDRATYVVSPMVGTFYTASSPDAPPFVKVGDAIGKDTIVCIIEAMKVFNEIPAECTGKIVACLVENGAAVEYGQKLFKVVPA
jgi:acetyl-CoA carboxylase biotin carboxyl carrier protein